jgi:hypothetical protein
VGSFYYQYHPTEPQIDSIRIAYRTGNTAGGDADSFYAGLIKYDTVTHYTDRNDGSGFVPFYSSWSHYNAKGLTDTFWMTTSGAPIRPDRKVVTEYNTQNNVSTGTSWMWNTTTNKYEQSTRTQHTYSAGKLVQALDQEYTNGAWRDYGRTRYVYAAGLVDSMVVESWDYVNSRWQLERAEAYVYGSSGLHDTMRYIDNSGTVHSQTAYTYTASGKLQRVSNFSKLNGTFSAYSINMTVYNAKDLPDTQYYYAPRGAHPDTAISYSVWHYGIGDKEDTATSYVYDAGSGSYVPMYRTVYTYNALQQRTLYYWEKWDAGRWEDMGEYRKYYYDNVPTIGVARIPTSFADVYIYPNPASSLLQVRLAAANVQPYTFTIFDAMGRRLRSHPSVQGLQVHTIPISDLQPGTYILTIGNGTERQSQQFVVAR